MKRKRMFLGVIGLALLPLAASAQIYQDASNSTTTVVRDPARQASTEIDAVLYNPAGTAFLDNGWHFSLNGKLANRSLHESYQAEDAEHHMRDVIPSLLIAYKKSGLTLSFSYADEGGYGDYHQSKLSYLSNNLTNINNQAFDTYKKFINAFSNICNEYDRLVSNATVEGRLYNHSFRIGAAYQFNPHLSGYLGLRLNKVYESTKIDVNQLVEKADGNIEYANDYFNAIDNDFRKTMQEYKQPYETLVELCNRYGIDASKAETQIALINILTELVSNQIQPLSNTPNTITLIDESTNGWGISPVIGIDYKISNFNFATKYEFETKINTQGKSLPYHIPSVLSLGVSWQPEENLKVSIGGSWHHQKAGNIYAHKQEINITNPDIIFNMGIADMESKIERPHGNLNSWDVSASVSFSPIDKLQLSVGYTFLMQSQLFKREFLQSSVGADMSGDIISGGLRYDINNTVQFEFGISNKMHYGVYKIGNSVIDRFRGTSMSAGININL